MPLIQGKSQASFNKNVSELIKSNQNKTSGNKRPLKQILAIAFATKREAEKHK